MVCLPEESCLFIDLFFGCVFISTFVFRFVCLFFVFGDSVLKILFFEFLFIALLLFDHFLNLELKIFDFWRQIQTRTY